MAGGEGAGPGGAAASEREVKGRGGPARTPDGGLLGTHHQGDGGCSTGCRKGPAAQQQLRLQRLNSLTRAMQAWGLIIPARAQ